MKFTITFAIIAAVAATFAAAAPLHGSNDLRRDLRHKHDERHRAHTKTRSRTRTRKGKGKKKTKAPAPTTTADWEHWADSPAPTPADQAWQADGSNSWDAGNKDWNDGAQPTPAWPDQPQPTDGGNSWDQGADKGDKHDGDNKGGDNKVGDHKGDDGGWNNGQDNGGNSGGSLSGEGQSGQVTTYNLGDPSQNGGNSAGSVACYTLNRAFSDSDFVAAIPASEFNLDVCGKTVHIKGPVGECDVIVVDSCVGGGCKNFDLSPAAMEKINGVADGVVDVKYSWLS